MNSQIPSGTVVTWANSFGGLRLAVVLYQQADRLYRCMNFNGNLVSLLGSDKSFGEYHGYIVKQSCKNLNEAINNAKETGKILALEPNMN